MTILVTGANGMIGSELLYRLRNDGIGVIGVDKTESKSKDYLFYKVDLSDIDSIMRIIRSNHVDRIIHLAALAHTEGEPDLSWDRYYQVNVECAKNIFECAGDIPILFISTVDVYGFYDGKKSVTPQTTIRPITKYAKSKAEAEEACKKVKKFDIYRFSPVYSEHTKRDIQKRYYLRYPKIAYQVGKGTNYEVLNIHRAVDEMIAWCKNEPSNRIRIIKDEILMWTPDCIRSEKNAGRANIVLHVPKWLLEVTYKFLRGIFGDNDKTYLLNKLIHPLRTEDVMMST